MSNNRMTDFRNKRQVKEEEVNFERQQEQINKLFELIVTLSGRYLAHERKINQMAGKTGIIANKAEYRSLALMQLLDERFGSESEKTHVSLNKNHVAEVAETLLVDAFEKESAEEDEQKGLVPSDEEIAAPGHFATFGLKFFYKGKELFAEGLPRGKIEIGKVELFPELDDQLKGMKVGEVKTFPLSMQGQTDTAEIKLMSLKRRKTPEPTPAQPEPNAN